VNFDNDPSVPFQRYGHTVVAYGRYVYLWGGRNDESACKTLFRFDTKTHSWSKPQVTGSIPGARDGHSAVIIRNRMFIFGGYEEDIGLFSQDVYSLDLQTLHWSFVPTAVSHTKFIIRQDMCIKLFCYKALSSVSLSNTLYKHYIFAGTATYVQRFPYSNSIFRSVYVHLRRSRGSTWAFPHTNRNVL